MYKYFLLIHLVKMGLYRQYSGSKTKIDACLTLRRAQQK
ncbi:hypothetical protein MuYL_1828 [Mucilaginibacter xinganensis]|uniref:Uncharacterized protein n=1 Tax=Mucilaginibacter xinganensis TaxID=1234841 RepID=A0A223NVM1_9SPHI|nr:hypothetical protein MuYL_1828 [Mucilaginibacter xinganensis]